MTRPDDDDPERPPDIEMGVSLKAESLRFEVVPETSTTFHGDTDGSERSGSERENLPDEVEPGVTYRDVRVRWGAAARLRSDVREDVRRRLDES